MTKQVQQEIESIKNQLVEKFKPDKIILFGGAAKGRMHQDSDLDFLIIKKDPRRHLDVEQQLHRLISYETATDFIFLRPNELEKRLKEGDFFLKEVLQEGRVLYAAS